MQIQIKIQDKEYKVKQSMRGLLYFEEETGKQVGEMKGLKDLLIMFYCTLKACNKETFNYNFDSFLDVLDDNPEIMKEFSDYMASLDTEVKPTEKKTTKSRSK